jgi:thymidine phosphorylase
VVRAIDNLQIARIARLAGAPLAKGAGVDLLRKQGDAVQQGEALYAIHAEFPADFRFARAQAGQDDGYRIDGVTGNGNGVPNGLNGGQASRRRAG